ncbi:MAG: Aldehyde ferredoxin oxidoreductase [Clostridia bacterium 62_21]|nr:MAG: Aldehyde ferredoxin oxidoreductase [Clostridia bacterium 62_21]HAG07295.1 aldehyde:ferredoxin oxidoreductase [Peptococcaceae bacterium]
MTPYGWQGKILRVDLSSGVISEEPTLPTYEAFVGGIGIGYKVIWDEAPTADPFSSENRIVFAVGPLTGTHAPSSGRTEVTSISPHVYAPLAKRALVSRSGMGGYWGAELKFAGYDAIIIQGKAARPVYLWIKDGQAVIKSAEHLWGTDAFTVQERIREELGEPKAQIACIGPAGENLVRIAPILHRSGNAAGQGGFGAVMGAKNLKAIAVRGTRGVQVADGDKLNALIREIRGMMPGPLGSTPLSEGTLSWTEKHIDPHDINKQALRFNQTKSCAPHLNKYFVKHAACYSCPLACYAYNYVPGAGGGAVSCTQWFYSWLGNQDEATFVAKQRCDQWGIDTFEMFPMIQLVWYLFDTRVGDKRIIDYVCEAGMLTSELVTDLQDLHYPPEGNLGCKGIETLLRMIAFRESALGDMLAEGFRRAVDLLAARFEELSLPQVADAVRGWLRMEGIMGGVVGADGGWGMSGHYDPRTYGYYWAVNFAVENRDPNRHSMTNLLEWTGLSFEQALSIGRKYWGEEVADWGLSDLDRDRKKPLTWNDAYSARANAVLSRFIHLRACIKDMLTVCDWVYPMMTSGLAERDYTGDISLESRLFSAVTGLDVDQEGLDEIAERVWNMHRVLTLVQWGDWQPVNLRKEHDQIPDRYFTPLETHLLPPFPPAPEPHPPLEREKFEAVKAEYYKLMGWDEETGVPTRATLERLGLKEVADRLEKSGIPLK